MIIDQIERVAKALFDYEQSDSFSRFSNDMLFGVGVTPTWELVTSSYVVASYAERYRQRARVAIMALENNGS